jgi:hypothetical protein
VPFLDFLAELPAEKEGGRTPLEKYALGVWTAHYWDKERCVYCRHGDYIGEDDREGSLSGFPAHQGAHLRLWVKTLLVTRDAGVKKRMEEILTKVLDAQITRAKEYGFIPFTFEPDVEGKKAKQNPQSDRLGRHALELSIVTAMSAPRISCKLRNLAEQLLELDEVVRLTEMAGWSGGGRKPKASPADLTNVDGPEKHGREIIRRVEWFRRWRDPAFLIAAERQAETARALFCDDGCPLPKAFAGGPRKTAAGEPFPDFYFRGAELMHAFALLGEAL